MDSSRGVTPVGVFVIILFLLIGVIVMGCMFYINWIYYKQRRDNNIIGVNGDGRIFASGHRSGYNRSTPIIITTTTRQYPVFDAETGAVVQKQQVQTVAQPLRAEGENFL